MPTVLLIEDDRLIAEPIARALKMQNYTVLTASNGATEGQFSTRSTEGG